MRLLRPPCPVGSSGFSLPWIWYPFARFSLTQFSTMLSDVPYTDTASSP
jgi:hypothetical protein